MGFTGFPTETAAEAQQSIDFLLDNRDLWTFGGLGDFVLTSGAIVAKQPERFGVTDVRPLPGSDVRRTLAYTEPISEAARVPVAEAKAGADLTGRYDRPWVGAIDTPHSFFYFDRFGTAVRSALGQCPDTVDPDGVYVANGAVVERPDEATLLAYHRVYGRSRREPAADRILFRRADGNILVLPPAMKDLLAMFVAPRRLADATEYTWSLGPAATERMWRLMLRRGLLRGATADDRAFTNHRR
jgi:hypothetical protein